MANDAEFMFNATVDDELFDELVELVGQQIVHLAVWEDSMADALDLANGEPQPPSFDMDVYLEGGVYFELYGVSVYPDPASEPWADRAEVERRLSALVRSSGTLAKWPWMRLTRLCWSSLWARKPPRIWILAAGCSKRGTN